MNVCVVQRQLRLTFVFTLTCEFTNAVCLLAVPTAPIAGGTLPWQTVSGAVSIAGHVARLVVWTLPTDLVENIAGVRNMYMYVVSVVLTARSRLRLTGLDVGPWNGALRVAAMASFCTDVLHKVTAMNRSVSATLVACSRLRANISHCFAFSRACFSDAHLDCACSSAREV